MDNDENKMSIKSFFGVVLLSITAPPHFSKKILELFFGELEEVL